MSKASVLRARIETNNLHEIFCSLATGGFDTFLAIARNYSTTELDMADCSTCGRKAVKSVLRLFDELVKCDEQGALKGSERGGGREMNEGLKPPAQFMEALRAGRWRDESGLPDFHELRQGFIPLKDVRDAIEGK